MPREFSAIDFDTGDEALARFFNETTCWSAPFGELLMENLPLIRGARLLDVGCATGYPLIQLAEQLGSDSECYGIDLWKEAVKHLQERLRLHGPANVQAILQSAEEIPFPEDHFDIVTSNLGINNFEDPSAVIEECKRVLKEGGTLAIATNVVGHMREFYEVYAEALRSRGMEDRLGALKAQEDHRSTVEEVRALFERAGLKWVKTVEKSFALRYVSGTAFLESRFVRFSFMGGWKGVVSAEQWPEVLSEIETRLNQKAASEGELRLSVPMAYLEFKA